MNIKELSKPNLKKILLTLILVIIFTPVQFDATMCDAIDYICIKEWPCRGCPYQTKTIMGFAMLENFDRFMAFKNQWISYLFIISGILAYLISCSFFHFFNSRNGKKKKTLKQLNNKK